MFEIGICGNFKEDINFTSGQIIKTKIFKQELEEVLGRDRVYNIDSSIWKKKPITFFISCINLIKNCNQIVIMPAQNGLKVLLPLFIILNTFFKKNIHYVVIGGWLPEYIFKNNFLKYFIKKLDTIHVETYSMINKLNNLGINRVYYMPNFKKLRALKHDDLLFKFDYPYEVCTFSRVMKEKGIEEAIKAVVEINKKYERIIYKLDIYGSIDENYKERFFNIINKYDKFIEYKGIVKYSETVNTLKNYFILLFPTYYQGEGFAGTLLDALASGLPSIASDWKYNKEIIKDGINGFIYNVNNSKELEEKLESIMQNPNLINQMKINCLEEYEKFQPNKIIIKFLKIINCKEQL